MRVLPATRIAISRKRLTAKGLPAQFVTNLTYRTLDASLAAQSLVSGRRTAPECADPGHVAAAAVANLIAVGGTGADRARDCPAVRPRCLRLRMDRDPLARLGSGPRDFLDPARPGRRRRGD